MPTLDFKGKSFVYTHHLSVPFRELVVDKQKSLPTKGQKPSLDDNLIIHGDNLHALKALLPMYAGKVDCIFIDPPYNTGNEGWCYNDNVRGPLIQRWIQDEANPVDKEDLERHDKWLCMMWPRLQLLYELLAEDGVLFVTIGEDEQQNLRRLLDETFGADNQVATAIWQKNYSPKNTAQHFSSDHDYIHVYAKHKPIWRPHLLARTEAQDASYTNPDNDPKGPWKAGDSSARNKYSKGVYPIKCPGGRVISGPPEGRYWILSEENLWRLHEEGKIWWGEDENNIPAQKLYLSEVMAGRVPQTLWSYREVGHTDEAKKEVKRIVGFATRDDSTITPKPARLISRVLEIATDKDSLILDSFAGSGATAHAVLNANKRDGGNRKFILVEMEDYADSLTAERVRRVINGYKFKGNQREELFREKVTWTKLKKASQLVEELEKLKTLEAGNFDRITPKVDDGIFTITGEKEVAEKVEGIGGSFTFATLGAEMTLDKLLGGDDAEQMPTYESLAKYVFYTATGRTLDKLPAKTKRKHGFIAETETYRVYLIYEPDLDWLRGNEAALTETLVDILVDKNPDKSKRLLVFAPAKFMSQKELTRRGVDFCQLPYAIHRILGDGA